MASVREKQSSGFRYDVPVLVSKGISFGIKSSAVTNFLKTNKINSEINRSSFSMNDEKVNQLLEESTVYISCEL